MPSLKNKLENLPQKPGVYMFKNPSGDVLYVGKAKNLEKRVKSYFNAGPKEEKTLLMLEEASDLDYIIVSSEMESLMLENNLIKQHYPRYNVLLRDDKNYQFIKIDYETEIPQIYTVRRIESSETVRPLPPSAPSPGLERDGERSKYFGPYTSGLSVKQTLKLLNRVFRLCRNKKVGSKPCFAYHLGRCPGVCCGKVSPREYRKIFLQIEEFLKNRQAQVLRMLRQEMRLAATQKRYEKAGAARDKIRWLEHLWQKQKIVSKQKVSEDILGIYQTPREAVINLFVVRDGRLIQTERFELKHQNAAVEAILEKFMLQYYQETSNVPREIIVSAKSANHRLVERTLSKFTKSKVKILVPKKGRKKQLLELAHENAKDFFERSLAIFQKDMNKQTLVELQGLLRLPAVPERIEGYDISNIQGTNPVGSMVVFTNGQPNKSQYRKFKIQSALGGPDDFAMMKEMLARRLKRLPVILEGVPTLVEDDDRISRDSIAALQNDSWVRPDLIIIDGGRGQLNVAVKVLKKYKLDIPVIGLAKRLEEIFAPGKKKSIILASNNPVLFLLQQIRDEAHRFAISFYRKRHRETLTHSRLDDVPGIGAVTRKKLLQHFGDTAAIRKAPESELKNLVGKKLTRKIKEKL